MDKIRISLYEEMYYWLFFYVKKINPYMGVKYTSSTYFQILKLFNILSFWLIIGHFLTKTKNYRDYMEGIIIFLFTFWVMMVILDFLILYPKRDYIISICEKFSKKRQIIGKIKFWVYAGLTFLLLVIGLIYIDK